MPHPDQRNMWDVEEETLCGDVGRFREATGMRQHSRCTQGEGDGDRAGWGVGCQVKWGLCLQGGCRE